jgi:hypothetical protein
MSNLQIRIRTTALAIAALFLLFATLPAQRPEYPEARISNGLLTARMYLPDANAGYYRSTRFDWSGAIYSLQYMGHESYGVWYDRIDPAVVNWVFEGDEIVSGLASALAGSARDVAMPQRQPCLGVERRLVV